MDLELDKLRLLRQLQTTVASAKGLEKAVIKLNHTILGTLSINTLNEWLRQNWVEKVREGHSISEFDITVKGIKVCEGEPIEIPKNAFNGNIKGHHIASTPIFKLYSRKNSTITQEQFQSALKLHTDFYIACNVHNIPTSMDWDKLVNRVDSSLSIPLQWFDDGKRADNFEQALTYVGTGLADILLLCVCYEYGLEECEKRLGWSARSGKIVLRIALNQLSQFYTKEFVDANI